jgi:hypothetical protein
MDGNGERLFPLTCGPCTNEGARTLLKTLKPAALFPEVNEPRVPMAGLWLYFSCFEEAHELADASKTQEADLWHGIVHRQEPDSGNAAYWFRKAGTHPVYEILPKEVAQVTFRIPEAEFRGSRKWDPFAFISFCDRARRQPGTAQERAAMEIQRAEWQVLFDYCARPTA